MLDGKNVALITDAGTPGISDPGEELVRQCYKAGVEVTSLSRCGSMYHSSYHVRAENKEILFCKAFLPKDKKEKSRVLESLKEETRTIIIYEAPHRLLKTLKELMDVLGDRPLTVCRELTKKYEEAFQTTFTN